MSEVKTTTMETQPEKFEFFPAFDKERNDRVVSGIFKASRSGVVNNPLALLNWANKNANNDK